VSNQVIEERIRQVAAEANIRQGRHRCSANIVLLVAHDADTFVSAIRRHFPSMFNDLSSSELKAALASGPVHGWNSVEVRNEDGERISGASDDGVKILVVRRASRILEPTQQVVLRSILIVDSQAIAGKTLIQVADYAAMRTLAGARPPATASGLDTILSLFDASQSSPARLTAVDKGYLRGLYRTHPNRRAMTETNTIVHAITRSTQAEDR
jgi:hypothetical protein